MDHELQARALPHCPTVNIAVWVVKMGVETAAPMAGRYDFSSKVRDAGCETRDKVCG